MFSGLALSKVEEDPTVAGWEFLVKDLIPVESGAIGHELLIPEKKTISRKFEFRNYYGIWEGFKNFDARNVEIYEVIQSNGAIVIADFSTDPTSASDVAVVAKQTNALSGRAIYFSYDAFDSNDVRFQSMTRQAVVFLLQDFLQKRFIV